jgi:hypothetical protein
MQRSPLRLPTPAVETMKDLDQALLSLQLMSFRESDDKNELQQRTAALTLEIQDAQVVEIGRKRLTFAEYRDALTENAIRYVEANRATVFAGDTKTRKLTHGEVSSRAQAPTLVDIDGKPATTLARLLLGSKAFGAKGLLVKLLEALATFTVNKSVTARELFNVKLTPDRKSILSLAQKKQLSAEWLAAVNLRVDAGDEKVSLKPNERPFTQTESRAA